MSEGTFFSKSEGSFFCRYAPEARLAGRWIWRNALEVGITIIRMERLMNPSFLPLEVN